MKQKMKGLKNLPQMGADLHLQRKSEGEHANTTVMSQPAFQKACEVAGIPVTRRQASKWRQGRGLARRITV